MDQMTVCKMAHMKWQTNRELLPDSAVPIQFF